MVDVTLCTLLHGAGSTPEFIERTFGPAVAAAGATLRAPDVRGASLDEMVTVIAEGDPGPGDVVGGVSLGAHAAVAFAASTAWYGNLYAVMPAWIGQPGPVAHLTGETAARIEATSVSAVLSDLDAALPADWVVAELSAAWLSMAPGELVEVLRVASVQPAPDRVTLRRVPGRVEIVALADDPTHPQDVARIWAEEIPRTTLTVLPRDLGGGDSRSLAIALPRLLSGSR